MSRPSYNVTRRTDRFKKHDTPVRWVADAKKAIEAEKYELSQKLLPITADVDFMYQGQRFQLEEYHYKVFNIFVDEKNRLLAKLDAWLKKYSV